MEQGGPHVLSALNPSYCTFIRPIDSASVWITRHGLCRSHILIKKSYSCTRWAAQPSVRSFYSRKAKTRTVNTA